MKVIRILIFLLIFNFFVLAGILVSQHTGNVVLESKIEYAELINVVDGDTIDVKIRNITERVRLLGINTPEKKEGGWEEARKFLQEFENKTIKLEIIKEDKDMYGRLLRYVFYNSQFLNKEILENGFAHFYAYEEDKYTSDLLKAEEKARKDEIGIWKRSKDECGNCIILIELNEVDPGEYVRFGNICSFDCDLDGWTINDDSSSHNKKLDFILPSLSEIKIDYEGRIWNDAGDSLYLRDGEGLLVLFYRY